MLGAPRIIGDLSQCSLAMEFEQLVPGATVHVQTVQGDPIDEWPVTYTRQVFDFHPGRNLTGGTVVQAVQSQPGAGGFPSIAKPVSGRPAVTALNNVLFVQPLYECAECLMLSNGFSGARVKVFSHDTEPLGESVVLPSGYAHVDLNRPLAVEDVLSVVQTACTRDGAPIISAPTPVPGSRPGSLSQIVVPQTEVDDVKACEMTLNIRKIMPGSFIILRRRKKNGTTTEVIGPVCVSMPRLIRYERFEYLEELVIETRLDRCKPFSNMAVTKIVCATPTNPPGLPKCVGADARDITLHNLSVGALVEISITTSSYSIKILSGVSETTDRFPFSPGSPSQIKLETGAIITVRQNLGGGPNDWSQANWIQVLTTEPSIPKPYLPVDGSIIPNSAPTLLWKDTGEERCNYATRFHLQIMDDVGHRVFENEHVTSPSAYVGGYLHFGVTYSWRVRAYHNNSGPSTWSDTLHFTTPGIPAKRVDPSIPHKPGDQLFLLCEECMGVYSPAESRGSDLTDAIANAKARSPSCEYTKYTAGECKQIGR